ncbi:MAG: Gfo/Idh/MocA family oxidoreductase [Candidatus Schekmanbacteria bacterium]|nr:Gfo/Idh/MocA family oxidoreductase [Candidatus Schekmanbacteria bacterium]
MLNLGIIGCGYWGPNLVRNFMEAGECRVKTVCDLNPQRLVFIKGKYPLLTTTRHTDEILADRSIDAVAIATPVSTHFQIAQKALQSGKHVMVEKPLTASSRQADELMELAHKYKKILMVDHTFIYTAAVRKMKELIGAGELGEIYYFDSVRVNLGIFQHDVNVMWDLAPHDLSIMDYLLDKTPRSVTAMGLSHLGNNIEDIAYITINYADNLIAHFHVNWLAPAKIRLIQIGGSDKMLVYDDMENSDKLKVYNQGIDTPKNAEDGYKIRVQYRAGNMYVPKLEQTEALLVECRHFLDCIRSGQKPLSDGEAGLRVVKILEAAEESLKNQGRLVKICT